MDSSAYPIVLKNKNKPEIVFAHEQGWCWTINLPKLRNFADSIDRQNQSLLVIFENDRPLGPAHAYHDDIRKTGKGLFSHFGENLYFSSSDNSNPNENNFSYSVHVYSTQEELERALPKKSLSTIQKHNNLGSPVNYRKQECSREVIDRDVSYAVQVGEGYLDLLPNKAADIKGKKILEIGPGINFGTAIILLCYGAQEIYVTDRFLAPWDDSYHPIFYQALKDWLASNRKDLDLSPLNTIIDNNSYSNSGLNCIETPLEKLDEIPDECIDIVFSNAVFEHLFNPRKAFKQLSRISSLGGIGLHQIDLRDHRDFSRPLEFLLLDSADFTREFELNHGECGNRLRPCETAKLMTDCGFELNHFTGNMEADEDYFQNFIQRLRQSSSNYRDWPEEKLRIISGRLHVTQKNNKITEKSFFSWIRSLIS